MKINKTQFQPTINLVATRIITNVVPLFLGTLVGYFTSGISYVVTSSIFSSFSSASLNQFWPLLVAAFINIAIGIPLSIMVARKLFPGISSGSAAQIGITLTTGVKRALMSFLLGLFGGITVQGVLLLIMVIVILANLARM